MAKKITKEMLKIYKPISNKDWMNYKLVKNDVTYHHIVKRCDGGKETFENGALLMPIAHQYLHIIEYIDSDTYIFLNRMFKIINEQQREPNKEQRMIIEAILREFEYKYRSKKGSKGKLLIKREYRERGD